MKDEDEEVDALEGALSIATDIAAVDRAGSGGVYGDREGAMKLCRRPVWMMALLQSTTRQVFNPSRLVR